MRNSLIFLVDESAVMRTPVARAADSGSSGLPASNKTKVESVATAINSVLAMLQAYGNLDIGLVGYHTTSDGLVDVGTRWPAALAGKGFSSRRLS